MSCISHNNADMNIVQAAKPGYCLLKNVALEG